MTKHPQQEQITNTEWIIDLEKFDNRIEKYVSKDTFCTFSSMDLKDTLDEIRTIVYNCIERRERSRTNTPAAPAMEPNPCEENGCIDIENCDEICEHMKIFSPAYVRAARKAEREQVLDALDKKAKDAARRWCPNGKTEFASDYDRDPFNDVRMWIRSLRRGGAP